MRKGDRGAPREGVLPARSQALAWGAGALALYVAVTALPLSTEVRPGRVLFDGLAPPAPYRWVNPPPPLAKRNQRPESGRAILQADTPLPSRAFAGTAATLDGQTGVTIRAGTIAPKGGASAAEITITPVDPATLGQAPPGLRFDGNAYRVEGVYLPSREPVVVRQPITVVLRYATGGTVILRFSGAGWVPLQSTKYHESLLLAADAAQMGSFAAAAPEHLPFVQRAPWYLFALFFLIGAMPFVVLFLIIRYGRRYFGDDGAQSSESQPGRSGRRKTGGPY